MNPNYEVLFGERFQRSLQSQDAILTQSGKTINFGHLINCAGQQSLEVAWYFGQAKNLSIFPMKGLYCVSKQPLDHMYNSIVYPIPLPGGFTLGVHSTMTPSGHMKIGPTTSPALALENYQGLQNINWRDLRQIVLSYSLIASGS